MRIVAVAIAPAGVDAYGWQGEKSGDEVVLSGFVPSEEERTEVAASAAALFSGIHVDNRVRVAAGEPRMDWLGAIKFAMGQLAKLGSGKVALGDRTYAIEGDAATAEAFVEIAGVNAQTLPASLELTSAQVEPPRASPYEFVAERVPGGVTIAGHVANDDDRRAILSAARSKFGSADIKDDLVFASGAPDDFADAATTVLQAVSRLAGGRAEIIDQGVTVSGAAYYPAAVDEISTSVGEALPKGFTVTASTIVTRQTDQPVVAERCRELLEGILETGRIEFNGNNADISVDSDGVLDRVSWALKRCPEVHIEIGAHSDSDGSASRNRERTQARADAIMDYLVTAGIRRERLTAVGYGESEPLADNSTEEGKAKNRRIAFTVELPDGG
jgi:OmpA-OmpF porin, OOP family